MGGAGAWRVWTGQDQASIKPALQVRQGPASRGSKAEAGRLVPRPIASHGSDRGNPISSRWLAAPSGLVLAASPSEASEAGTHRGGSRDLLQERTFFFFPLLPRLRRLRLSPSHATSSPPTSPLRLPLIPSYPLTEIPKSHSAPQLPAATPKPPRAPRNPQALPFSLQVQARLVRLVWMGVAWIGGHRTAGSDRLADAGPFPAQRHMARHRNEDQESA